MDEEYADDWGLDEWAFTGSGLDWVDRANDRGWCWRDIDPALFRLAELLFAPSGLAIGRLHERN